jgi:rSAM/selenodomain-associated transferase 2
MRFSVIIPTLNEENHIERQIKHINKLNPETEIIIVDGGSQDATMKIAKQNGTKVIHTRPGRGTQQRAGGKIARNDILLFLHADTRLPDNVFTLIKQNFSDPTCIIATFRISFYPQHNLLKIISLFSRYDTPFTRFGDQCIVIRRDFYTHIGGFPEWKLFEDINLLEKARKYTQINSIPSQVVTSSRRFQKNGVLKQLLWNTWLILLYYLGRDPEKLAEMYHKKL